MKQITKEEIIMKKEIVKDIIIGVLAISTLGFALNGSNDNDEVLNEKSKVESEYSTLKANNEKLQTEHNDLQTKYNELETNYSSLQKDNDTVKNDYASYKEKMGTYEKLSEAEAEAKLIEAENTKKEAEAKKKAEADAKKKEEEEAKKKKEAEAKKGYDTGISYDKLARTPDKYTGSKIKFKGKVLQVVEGDDETQIRLAVNQNYKKVIYCVYKSDITKKRVLEDDTITVYGISTGLLSYQSTMGGKITIPSMVVDKLN